MSTASSKKSKGKAKAKRAPRVLAERPELIRVRSSRIHGKGVFSVKPIRKGARVIEYLGDRVTHKEADARYETKTTDDNHTFLFIVDRNTVIDAAVGGNDARFINHQCSGNCESAIENRRVFIDAVRNIAPGDELGYDYEIGRDKDDPPNVDEIYACRCGTPKCRGTMLEPAKKKTAKRRKPVKARKSRRPTAQRRGEPSRRRA